MKRWGWLLSLLPAGIGILIAVLALNETLISNHILYLRGGLAAIALRLGLFLSAVILILTAYIRRTRRKHQEQMDRLSAEMTEERRRFLQRLDHELKNPLTAIRTGLSNINQANPGPELDEEVAAVNTQVLRVSQLVADLRKLAALETLPIEAVEVDLAEILTDVVEAAKAQVDGSPREIGLIIQNAPWPLPKISADPDLILLAIHNLLDNAVKFTTPEDTIEVRAYEAGSQVVIEVADTGPGIPEDELEHIWEELYRGAQARGIPGSGLGLPLVQAIIHQHGGQITLRSRPNQGTVFIVRLPVRQVN